MAFGLPVEGTAGPFAGSAVSPAPTCSPDQPAGTVLTRLEEGIDRILVVNDQGVVLGAARRLALEKAEEEGPVSGVMELSPSTVRPSVELADLTDADEAAVVTDPDGKLLGVVELGAGGEARLDALGATFLDLAHAVSEHFADRDPSEEEVQAFLDSREEQREPGGP